MKKEIKARIFCDLCKREINKKTDSYYKVTCFDCGKELKDKIYHHEKCWVDRTDASRKVNALMKLAGNIGMRTNKALVEAGY